VFTLSTLSTVFGFIVVLVINAQEQVGMFTCTTSR